MASRSAVKVANLRTGCSARLAGTQAQCSLEPISIPAASGLMSCQPASADIFFFRFRSFAGLFFIVIKMLVRGPRVASKNCNLLNRIVPQVLQNLRNFTNGSARNLGTRLLHGHLSTIATPAIARRKPDAPDDKRCAPLKKVSSMEQPTEGGCLLLRSLRADYNGFYKHGAP